MRRSGMVVIAILLLASGCTGKAKPVARGSSSPSASPTKSSPATPSPLKRAKKIVAARGREIILYDVESDTSRVVAGADSASRARFETERLITYVTGADTPGKVQLAEVDLMGGPTKTLFEAEQITGYEWSPSRSVVGFIGVDHDVTSLFIWRRATGKIDLIRRLGTIAGRDGEDADDMAVRWEADGERVNVVDTALDSSVDGPKPTMYVIRQGKDVVPPRNGAHVVWRDVDHLAYMRWAAPNDWRLLDVTTGSETALGLAHHGVRARLAPDLSAIAYDEGPTDQSVHLFSLRTMTDRKLAEGGVGAIWIDPEHIAVTDVEKCVGQDCGPDPWRERGGSSLIGLDGKRTALHLPTTMDADVWF